MLRDDIIALFARRQAAWRAHDARLLAADHAPDGVVISPTGGVLEGRDEIERIYRIWFTAFPDLVFTTEDVMVDGGRVALLCQISGTHGGDFFGMPRTGRRIEIAAVFVYQVGDDGLITHERRVLDFTGVLVQVGVLRAKPGAH